MKSERVMEQPYPPVFEDTTSGGEVTEVPGQKVLYLVQRNHGFWSFCLVQESMRRSRMQVECRGESLFLSPLMSILGSVVLAHCISLPVNELHGKWIGLSLHDRGGALLHPKRRVGSLK